MYLNISIFKFKKINHFILNLYKSGRQSVIPEGNQFVNPPCNPGEVVTFHSMTHDPGAVYKGYLEEIDTHRGRKAGIATITFTA